MVFVATSCLRGPFGRARDLRTTGVGREGPWLSSPGPVLFVSGVPSTPSHTVCSVSPDLRLLPLSIDIQEGPV